MGRSTCNNKGARAHLARAWGIAWEPREGPEWPLVTSLAPSQFLKLAEDESWRRRRTALSKFMCGGGVASVYVLPP